MARTKASVGAKVSSGKSSKARCSAAPPPSSSSSSGSSNKSSLGSGGGGNPVCAQPTPKWQRPITNFFISKEVSNDGDSDDGAGSSTPKHKKRNVIQSDDEDAPETTPQPQSEMEERPRNSVLDESIELGPLTGEDSHKIEEYYPKNGETNHNGENEEIDTKNGESLENDQESLINDQESLKNDQESLKNGQESLKNGHKNSEEPFKNVNKGKGVGKKTNKENVSANIENEKRKSVKRDFEDIEENDQVSKKVKVN